MINDHILKRLDDRLKDIKQKNKNLEHIYFSEKTTLNAVDILVFSDVSLIAALGNHGNIRVPQKYRDLNTWIETML